MTSNRNVMTLIVLVLTLFCTYSNSSFSNDEKILNGQRVTDPTLIHSIGIVTSENMCTGFAIAPNFIMTARHCNLKVDEEGNSSVSAFNKDGSPAVMCDVLKVFTPPKANPKSTNVEDFVIGKVSCIKIETWSPYEFTTPFHFPAQNEKFEGVVNYAGHGTGEGRRSQYLNYTEGKAVNGDYSGLRQKLYEGQGIGKEYDELIEAAAAGRNLCFLDSKKKSGIIHGDSGGPVYVKNDSGYKVVSLNSTMLLNKDVNEIGYNEARLGSCGPNLAYYADWINSVITSEK